MKTSKISRSTYFLILFFSMLVLTSLLSSCDMLDEDKDIDKNTPELTGTEVYVAAQGATYIDLNSRVSTNQSVKFSIVAEPSHGTLNELVPGILEYRSDRGFHGQDFIAVDIKSQADKLIAQDTIIMNVENDSTNLPCGIYTAMDFHYSYVAGSSVEINVLANDYLCGDLADYKVSIYRPQASYPPYNGQAEVNENGLVVYTSSNFPGADKLIYKVANLTDTTQSGLAVVHITGNVPCMVDLQDDVYIINNPKVGDTFTLDVFKNDILCDAINDYLYYEPLPDYSRLISYSGNTEHGVVTNNTSINYEFTSIPDHTVEQVIQYSMCADGVCSTGNVTIKIVMEAVPALRLTEMNFYQLSQSSTNPLYTWKFEYDASGNVIRTTHVQAEYTYNYEYNEANQVTEALVYWGNHLKERYVYQYQEDSARLIQIYNAEQDVLMSSYRIITYPEEFRSMVIIDQPHLDTYVRRIEAELDIHGNVIHYKSFMNSGEFNSEADYVYDDKHNPLARLPFNINYNVMFEPQEPTIFPAVNNVTQYFSHNLSQTMIIETQYNEAGLPVIKVRPNGDGTFDKITFTYE